MSPEDFDRWQRIIGLNGAEVQATFDIGLTRLNTWKKGQHPVGLGYAMAWTLLYGVKDPFPVPELPEHVRKTCNKLKIKPQTLGDLLGFYSTDIRRWLDGRKSTPKWVGYALAWLLLYGSRSPFPDARVMGIRRCPTCGR